MKKDINENSMTKIVDMLEKEGTFTEVVCEILTEICNSMEITNASLMQIDSNNVKLNTIISYNVAGNEEKAIQEVLINSIQGNLFGNTVNAFEQATSDAKIVSTLVEMNIGALISAPIFINDSIAMYLVLISKDEERTFSQKEKIFASDVSKIIQSIAQKKVINNSLLSSYELLREILGNIGSGVAVCNKETGKILFENDIAYSIPEVKRTIKEGFIKFYETGCIFNNKKPIENYDSESGLWFELSFAPLKWIDGSSTIICTATDITQKKKNQQKIEYQAHNDFLTGLYNRMKCENDLRKYIRKSIKDGSKGAILFIDLDNFKHINDGLGHQYGDVLLQQVAAGMQGVPGLRNHCYRMGGDEFLIIIEPNIYNQLDDMLVKITDLFNRPWYLMGTEYYCTMSMGIAKFPADDSDVNELIKKADIAMYEAKKGGKNQYAFYKASDEVGKVKQLDIENNMRLAIASECNEFVVFYQPVVDAMTGDCVSCEALIRWNSKSLGFMGPGEFIPLAEYLGLITSIGDYVLETACSQCRMWNEHGYPDFRVNVNLSVVQLMQKDVIENVTNIIARSGVNPKNIVLEITESFAINDMDRVMKIVEELKKLGPKIALDDFGTGYSSLNYIKQLPFDIIKIDKSFIDDIETDNYSQAFVKLIVDLSKNLNVKICVEGVEKTEQYDILYQTGADYIQGYLFGKPVNVQEFEEKYLGKNLK